VHKEETIKRQQKAMEADEIMKRMKIGKTGGLGSILISLKK